MAGTTPPDELSTIAVFDSHCARVYVTSEQNVAYLPYGLDVVESLANQVHPELTRRLDTEIANISVDRQPFDHMLGETSVGQLVSSLNHRTDIKKINTLAKLSGQETSRITELASALSEPDPKAKSNELRLSAGRLKGLAERIDSALDWVSDVAVDRLRSLDEKAVAATQAEKLAAKNLRCGEDLLPGTGEPIWRELFEAARRFSTDIAYPGHPFPNTEDEAVCLLCQQPLRDSAERLQRFEWYIKEDSARTAEEKRQRLETAKQKIEDADLLISPDKPLGEELDQLDATVAPIARTFEATIEERRVWMLKAVASHCWENVPALSENPRKKTRDLAARQLRLSRTCERASDQTKSKALKAESTELRARQSLAWHSQAMVALVERMKRKSALESCRKDLRTRPISDKSKEFASSAVTTALEQALKREFQALKIGSINVKLKGRSEKGKMKYRLILDLPTSEKLEQILSEGEQRAIALGSFMAELSLANHSSGIVFDDPVSSLDHQWRSRFAKRLVVEAERRQVIIFTHDTSFLGQLRDEIENAKVAYSIQYLEWENNYSGNVRDGFPREHQGYKQRIDSIEKAQKALKKKPWPEYPNQKESSAMRHQYDELRATIERVIQDVVFNGVIKRYRDWIRVGNLEDVVGFRSSECKEIRLLYERCNSIVSGHDPSSEKNAPVPSADDLGKDIECLKNVIETIKSRRKKPKTAP